MDALTSMYWPEFRAAIAMTSSVKLPSVALSSPPTASPVFTATDSVARLNIAASGMMAQTERTNSNVCDSGLIRWNTNRIGTNTSIQSSGLWAISFSSCFMMLQVAYITRHWPIQLVLVLVSGYEICQ